MQASSPGLRRRSDSACRPLEQWSRAALTLVEPPFNVLPSGLSLRVEDRVVRKCKSTAFTLIELLVVMAIMIILVSAVVGASLVIMGKARIKRTEAMLGTLAQALEQYKVEHRMYVPYDPDDERTTWPLWQAIEHEAKYLTVGAKYKQAGDTFEDPETGASVQRFFYIDAWRLEIRYDCTGDFSRFILRSSGPDVKLDTGDDIIAE